MRDVRKSWKIKPFTRIKESDKVYKRTREKEAVREQKHRGQGRILALDFGEKRVGVAISDPLRLTAQGLTTLVEKTTEEILSFVGNLRREYTVLEIVLGYPLLMSGEEGPMAGRVREFAEELKKRVFIPVVLWDERLSSKEAEKLLGGTSRGKKEDVDRVSACLILQSYLDSVAD